MTALLDVIRAEIEPLEARLGVLREMERLAVSLDGGGGGGAGASDPPEREGRPDTRGATARQARREAGVSPAPARSPSPAGGVPGAKTQAVIDVLRTHRDWMSVSEIAAALGDGTSPNTLRNRMGVLVGRGLVEARGATSSRRYRAAPTRTDRPTTAPKPPAALSAQREDRAALDAEIAKRNGGDAMRSIHRLKRQALAAIAADPGALTEPRLAMALSADREDVALACGELLLAGEIHLQPDGAYTTRLGGGPTMDAPPELRQEQAA